MQKLILCKKSAYFHEKCANRRLSKWRGRYYLVKIKRLF
ncbi:hypothetical protein CF65_01037 [Aggregatibacter actinomycetemcomitans HK1651]|nr:hypothetical protein CF65_01037 [Aggregatibacter actinomycetemcomitans HK1651]